MKKPVLALLTCALAFVLVMPAAQAQEGGHSLSCAVIPTLMLRYVDSHVAFRKMDPKLADRVVELYVDRLDNTRSMLTVAEEKTLRRDVKKIFTNIQAGRCSDLDALHKKQIGWHKEMEEWARQALAKPVELDKSLSLQMDPQKRKRPKNANERDALRRSLIHFQLANYIKSGTKGDEAQKKLVHRYELITKRVSEMSELDLYSEFLNAWANALDPHSTYFSPDDLEDFRISMDLALEGIGAVLSSKDGYTEVQEVVPGGAADRQGTLKAKDKIIAVGQGKKGESVDVIDMSLRDVVRMIRGKKGTTVKLTVLRQREGTERKEILIVRDKIDLSEQAAKLRWEKIKRKGKTLNIAVIDLPSFYGGGREPGSRDCTEDMRNLLAEIQNKGADGLVLDLSRNGGGLLQAAVDISGLFIARGAIVAVDGPTTPKKVLNDVDPRIQYNGPMVVLTSSASASASEILAGALQDYDRALIVGDVQTFGKGTVQNIVPLPPGFGALKVTTSLFFLPGGRSTQSDGVPADIIVPSIFSGQDFGERTQPFALPTRKLPNFRSEEVNVSAADQAWVPITKAQLAALKKTSAKRIKKSEDFKKIDADVKKLKKNDGVILISELLEDPSKPDEDEDEDKKKELTPQAKEAIEIVADLASTQSNTSLGKK